MASLSFPNTQPTQAAPSGLSFAEYTEVPIATDVAPAPGVDQEGKDVLRPVVSTGESKLSPGADKAVREMDNYVQKLTTARQRLLELRRTGRDYLSTNNTDSRINTNKIRELTKAGKQTFHEKHNEYRKMLNKLGPHMSHIIPTQMVKDIAKTHAEAATAINEIRDHHERSMKNFPLLFKKEGTFGNQHRVFFPHGVGATKVSLWEYDGKRKFEKKGDGAIQDKSFPQKHEEDYPSAKATVDRLAAPSTRIGGRKTRKHRRKHKRKTRKHKRKRKTKKRKHHRRKHKRKTRRR